MTLRASGTTSRCHHPRYRRSCPARTTRRNRRQVDRKVRHFRAAARTEAEGADRDTRAGRRLALWRVSSQSSASGWASGRRLNRSHVPNGVRCSELALHSVPAQSPQTTNAQCARGEEPKATEFDCGASSCWIDLVQAIRVLTNQRQAYETRHTPTAPRVPRVVRGGVRAGRVGGGRGTRRTRAPQGRSVGRGTPSRSP